MCICYGVAPAVTKYFKRRRNVGYNKTGLFNYANVFIFPGQLFEAGGGRQRKCAREGRKEIGNFPREPKELRIRSYAGSYVWNLLHTARIKTKANDNVIRYMLRALRERERERKGKGAMEPGVTVNLGKGTLSLESTCAPDVVNVAVYPMYWITRAVCTHEDLCPRACGGQLFSPLLRGK